MSHCSASNGSHHIRFNFPSVDPFFWLGWVFDGERQLIKKATSSGCAIHLNACASLLSQPLRAAFGKKCIKEKKRMQRKKKVNYLPSRAAMKGDLGTPNWKRSGASYISEDWMWEWEDLRLHDIRNPLLNKDHEIKQRHQRPDIVSRKSLRAIHFCLCKKNAALSPKTRAATWQNSWI